MSLPARRLAVRPAVDLDVPAFITKARSLWDSAGGDPARLAFLWRALGALAELPITDELLFRGLAAPTNRDLLAEWLRANDGAREPGGPPDQESVQAGLDRLRAAGRVAREAWIGPEHLSSEEVAARLGISRQAVNVRRSERRLLALSEGRSYRYPAWQFTGEAVLPGLERVLEALGETPPMMVVQFLRLPQPLLDDRSPFDVLVAALSLPPRPQADAYDAVVRAARLFGEQAGG